MLVVILGPTGSGKTALSVALGRRFDGEIVSCDSVAVYCGLEIGSAKPSAEQRELVPHHLLDVVAPDAFYTAGTMPAQHAPPSPPSPAGASCPSSPGALAFTFVLCSKACFPVRSDQRNCVSACSAERKREGPAHLHRILKRLDPASAARIHANDLSKVIRAIEVTMAAARPMSEAWKEGREALTGYRVLRLGLDPERAATL